MVPSWCCNESVNLTILILGVALAFVPTITASLFPDII